MLEIAIETEMVVCLIFICCSINVVESDRETLKQSDDSAAADAVDTDGDDEGVEDDENDETNENASPFASMFHSTGRQTPITQHMYVG